MAYVFIVKLTIENNDFNSEILKILQSNTQRKISRSSTLIRKKQVYVSELLKYYMISFYKDMNAFGLEYMRNEHGKPYIDSTYKCKFNISHSAEYVVGIVDHEEVGIDIENIKEKDFESTPLHLFHSNEIEQLKNRKHDSLFTEYLYTIWTLKEAYLKALGVGLTKKISTIEVTCNKEGIRIVDHEESTNTTFDYCKALYIENTYIMSTVTNNICNYIYLREERLIKEIEKHYLMI